jgi:hypothetical protein
MNLFTAPLACFYASSLAITPTCDDTRDLDLSVWKYAYHADYLNAHRKILEHPLYDSEDIILNTFMHVYLAYRMGDQQLMDHYLKMVDYVVENQVIH